MRVRSEVSAEKLRGGFYTPEPLVRHVLNRVRRQGRDWRGKTVLEPSAGDGAFLRGIAAAGLRPSHTLGIEIAGPEATKAASALAQTSLSGQVLNRSTLSWTLEESDEFDIVVGNLPFVRFQFVEDEDRAYAEILGERHGVAVAGVSNLWLPMLLAALTRLRVGGEFSLVLPAECFTGVSAGAGRKWLLDNVAQLDIDLFAPGSYPNVLQEVVVLSGVWEPTKRPGKTRVVVNHFSGDRSSKKETHHLASSTRSWTELHLNVRQAAALEEARSLVDVEQLGALARFEVSTVTGANQFFSLTSDVVAEYELEKHVKPLCARLRHAPGLMYTEVDRAASQSAGSATFLLDATAELPGPEAHQGLAAYIEIGEQAELHERYKCRIRAPWYRVPPVHISELMLGKRSHQHPRVIVNTVGAATTDTIYRGRVVDSRVSAASVAASFHNSLTLLTAELEGRSFGGGVLELVPSEISRLLIPVAPSMAAKIQSLDTIAREVGSGEPNSLIDTTNQYLVEAGTGLTGEIMECLEGARSQLAERRLSRNSVQRETVDLSEATSIHARRSDTAPILR